MKVDLHQHNLTDIRERFRVIHEMNLHDLRKLECQRQEHNLKLVTPIQPKPKPASVDVYA